jgi:hypothetical protein
MGFAYLALMTLTATSAILYSKLDRVFFGGSHAPEAGLACYHRLLF